MQSYASWSLAEQPDCEQKTTTGYFGSCMDNDNNNDDKDFTRAMISS